MFWGQILFRLFKTEASEIIQLDNSAILHYNVAVSCNAR